MNEIRDVYAVFCDVWRFFKKAYESMADDPKYWEMVDNEAYSLFEKQEVKGENIDSTLSDIERILDTLVKGFTRQLDRMFRADALDISTDIEVLESMMEQDGLTGGTAFQTAPDEQSK